MLTFKICDVKGDGNCYYRCIYQIAKVDKDVADSLFIENLDDEDVGAGEVREYVALSLKYEKKTQTMLKNLVELYKEAPCIVHNYPLLNHVDTSLAFKTVCKEVADKIEETNMMASSFEHEVICDRLSTVMYDAAADLKLIILQRQPYEDVADIADKWLRQLHVMLPKMENSRVAILINEDNIHYKYAKFMDKIVIRKDELKDHIEQLMAESSDDESNVG